MKSSPLIKQGRADEMSSPVQEYAADTVIVRLLGQQDYLSTWQQMRDFTDTRQAETPDEIWLLEHFPVFTQGQNGKPEHILNPGTIPVISSDRGGQVTYHGPGQLMVYTLIDMKRRVEKERRPLYVRELVSLLEQSVINLLAAHQIEARAKCEAPGVYVNDKKICSIGLRIRRGCAYHGIALNVAMDLSPFTQINPCGFPSLQMTQLADLGGPQNTLEAGQELINYLIKNLSYTSLIIQRL